MNLENKIIEKVKTDNHRKSLVFYFTDGTSLFVGTTIGAKLIMTQQEKKMDSVNNPNDLKKLYQKTSFVKKTNTPLWEDGKLGDTGISCDETSTEADCLFIQELVRLYKAGKLAFKTNDAFFKK